MGDKVMEKLTRIVHVNQAGYDVYIGRPSEWGNPFIIGEDGTRDEVINKYRQWFLKQTHLHKKLVELRGKRLGCWCHPRRCHGEVLLEFIEGMENGNGKK